LTGTHTPAAGALASALAGAFNLSATFAWVAAFALTRAFTLAGAFAPAAAALSLTSWHLGLLSCI
jgi:hypothetical protein